MYQREAVADRALGLAVSECAVESSFGDKRRRDEEELSSTRYSRGPFRAQAPAGVCSCASVEPANPLRISAAS